MKSVEQVINIFATIVVVGAVVTIATNPNARQTLQAILDTYYKSLTVALRG